MANLLAAACYWIARRIAWGARSLYRRDFLSSRTQWIAFGCSQRLYRLGISFSRAARDRARAETPLKRTGRLGLFRTLGGAGFVLQPPPASIHTSDSEETARCQPLSSAIRTPR